MTSQLWEVTARDLEDQDAVDHLWPLFKQVERDTRGEWTLKAIVEGIQEPESALSVFAAVEDGKVLAIAGVGMLRFSNFDQIGRFWWCVAQPNTLSRWVHHFSSIGDWLKARGCSRIDGTFRKGWVRVLRKYGLKDTHAVCEMEL